MSDVEGVRNLIGTGLVEFVGADDRGHRARLLDSHQRDHDRRRVWPSCWSSVGINKAFATIFADFPGTAENHNAEVTGRLTESLSGVRVVKGYHAEGREKGSSPARERLLDNVLKTLTATSTDESFRCGADGHLQRNYHGLGAHKILAGTMTLGTFLPFNIFLGLLVAQSFKSWPSARKSRGHHRSRAHARNSQRELEDDEPGRTITLDP